MVHRRDTLFTYKAICTPRVVYLSCKRAI